MKPTLETVARSRIEDALAKAKAENNHIDEGVCRLVLTLFDKD